MQAPVYRLRELRVELSARPVLDIASIDLPGGRVVAVVGPNGAGKTTLLRVLALLQPPTAGVVELEGRPVDWRSARSLTALRRRVTLVAQSPLLFRRSVRGNVAYGLRARRLVADDRVDVALAAVGLAGLAARPAWKLSGGETRRVALARALAVDPTVYLLDEPTANVDPAQAAAIEELIDRLRAGGKTVVLTTHDPEQAARLGDAVLSMVDGRVTPIAPRGGRYDAAPGGTG